MWTSILSITTSAIALAISFITLWRAQLKPFKPILVAGPMKMRVHQISNKADSWWLPHFSVSLGVTNAGSTIGRVLDVHAVVHYTALPVPDAQEVFACQGEYDPVEYEKTARSRFTMADEAQLGPFTPFAVLPKTTVTKFYVFDHRWDSRVLQKEIQVEVRILTDRSGRWVTVDRWTFHLDKWTWTQLSSGSSFSSTPSTQTRNHPGKRTVPEDLHKYTLDAELDEQEVDPVPPSYEISNNTDE